MEYWSKPIAAGAICALFALSLYGWGRLGERLLRIRWPWPMTICVGLLAVIFLGGIVNLAGIAYAAMLDTVAGLGVLLGAGALYLDRGGAVRSSHAATRSRRSGMLTALPGASLILATFAFQAVFLTPPAAFNIHDDFETYLPMSLRMLQTGTLEPGPFSFVGINTLGAQGYLQGFVAAHWPVEYVDAVDSLFGLALCGTLMLAAARHFALPGWLAALLIALLIAISPQYVNVSTLYLGSALLIFLLFVLAGARDDGTPLELASAASAITIGMVYAALVALKATFALVVTIHFALAVAAVSASTRRVRPVVTWCATLAASAVVLLLPWFLIHAYKLLPVMLGRGPSATPAAAAVGPAAGLDIFSTAPLFYGFSASHAHYAALAGLALLCALPLAWQVWRRPRPGQPPGLYGIAGCLTLPAFYGVHMLLIGGSLMGFDTALRYATPVFIGAAPAAIVLAGASLTQAARGAPGPDTRRLLGLAALGLLAAGLVWGFSGSLRNRAGQAIRYGCVSAFLYFQPPPKKQDFFRYNTIVFQPFTREHFLGMQNRVPAGDTILSYVSSSLHYDFSRNRILDVDPGGLGGAWLRFPFEGSIDDARRFLREHGVSHVLWEYRGYAVPTPLYLQNPANFPNPADRRQAQNKLEFFRVLEYLSERSEILVDDGSYRLFRLR